MASGSVQRGGFSDSSTHAERTVFGLFMIAAPILMLGAASFHPPHGVESGSQYYHAAHDHSTPFWVSHTCFFLAAVLFVPTKSSPRTWCEISSVRTSALTPR